MIAIIKGCGSNISSIQFAFDRLGYNATLTADKEIIKNASHVILPGVGHAKAAMEQLHSLGLVNVIKSLTQPVLGICLGMQLLYDFSEEGDVDCLSIIPGRIQKLPHADNAVLPHMGWNKVRSKRCDNYAYYVHTYAAPINDFTVAKTFYAKEFSAIVARNNFFGMQFHPEKSGDFGEALLADFLHSRLI